MHWDLFFSRVSTSPFRGFLKIMIFEVLEPIY